MGKTQKSWLAGGLLALAAGYWGWANRRLFSVRDITSGESAAYPELRSRVYYADMAQAIGAAEQALNRLPRWKMTSRDTENDALEAEAGMPISLLKDEITLYFFALDHGQTRVTIRSRSCAGWGDLGRNAAHIRELQAAMDNRLNAGAAF